jgi:WxcM-like, C-terminal
MRGVRLIDLDRHVDPRGSLIAFAGDSPLPFEIKNAYFILDCPPDAVRAEHALSGHTALIVFHRGVTVDLDSGTERGSLRLTGPDRALIIRAGVWFRLSEFEQQTALVVLTSEAHADMTRFDQPVPALLDVET